jgi:putative DNA primase/helicase
MKRPELADEIERAADEVKAENKKILQELGDKVQHDAKNAFEFVSEHDSIIRYVPELGEWLTYDGKRWVIDTKGVAVLDAVTQRHRVESIAEWKKAIEQQDTKKKSQQIQRAKRLGNIGSIQAVVTLARADQRIVARYEHLDANLWLLNVANGIVNLQNGELQPHDPKQLMTKLANVEYDENAECPQWQQFLDRIIPDTENQDFIQHFIGSCLTGEIRDQYLVLFIGGGANGKSVFVEVIREMLNDYAAIIEPGDLVVTRNEPHPTSRLKLMGARFATCNEVEGNARLSDVKVKRLTGGDTLTGRGMGKDFIDFKPTFKPILIANHKPPMQEQDEGIRRRLIVFPFNVTIPSHERNPDLKQQLLKELPGILAWAVRGCLAWNQAGRLNLPFDVENATRGYIDDNDTVQAFINECCQLDPKAKETKGDFHKAYSLWCERSGVTAKNTNAVSRQLKPKFGEVGGKARSWLGVKVLAEHRENAQYEMNDDLW